MSSRYIVGVPRLSPLFIRLRVTVATFGNPPVEMIFQNIYGRQYYLIYLEQYILCLAKKVQTDIEELKIRTAPRIDEESGPVGIGF